ncbi:MAG: hypothetical protein INR65_12890 [Gluconacetobacter diazotrophicus]|nr:hypothetical protein [Gluconacetobacter diazotrophicus]
MGTERIDATGSGSNTGSGTGAGAVPSPGRPANANNKASGSGFSFHDLLEDLNPLQYIPVVGSIYRAVTGDEGNSTLRFIASLGTSFALGGPLGLGLTVAEKALGIDPERIGRQLLGHLLHPHAAVTVEESGNTTEPSAAAQDARFPASRAWSQGELAAYGVTRTADGSLSAHGLSGADLLNTLELGRLRAGSA